MVVAVIEEFVEQGRIHGETILMRNTLEEALDFYNIKHLKDLLQNEITTIQKCLPN